MDTWVELGILKEDPELLQNHYAARRQGVQSKLGLSYPHLAAGEAGKVWIELRQHERLFQQIKIWQDAGHLKTCFLPGQYARLLELRARLSGYQGPQYPETDQERLDEINFLLDAVDQLNRRGEFLTTANRLAATEALWKEKLRLENILTPPVEIKSAVVSAQPEPVPASPAKPVPVAPPEPRPPLRDVLWQSILSERTLQGLLFLAIFLLFIAAISFVIWGWRDFSAPVRVAIPAGFTALFFVLGWVVGKRTHLERSAVALSAIAALLIPIDCYTVYANYGSPPDGWPEFWLITSLVCLVAYIVAALRIQSRFFGYITGIAAGSTLLALLEVFTDVSRDWYYAALTVLAVGMILLAGRVANLATPGRWLVFVEPFRYLGLWLPAALMPLTLGLRIVTRDTYDALHYAMAFSWLLGGLILAWGAIFYRSRSLSMLSVSALPVSVYMLQGGIFYEAGINFAWHAFGLACLTPLYLYTAYRLLAYKEDAFLASFGGTIRRWSNVLVVVTALLSLTNLASGTAAAASHAVLALTMTLSAVVWQRPRTLYAASFFSFTAVMFAVSELDLALNQLGVGWISLAILHVLLVLFLARPGPDVERRKPFLPPLVVAAYLMAMLAILPPIFMYDGQLLSYALGNGIAMSLWGAYLAYKGQPGFLPVQGTETKKPIYFWRLLHTGALYHWLAALLFPFWLWIVTENNKLPEDVLPLLLALLAWAMVIFSHRLIVLAKECRLAWRVTGLAVSVAAPLVAFSQVPDGYIPAIALLAVGLLYFVDTLFAREGSGFYPAGLVTAWGAWLLLARADVNPEIITFVLCILVLAYILAGLEAERRRSSFGKYTFLAPLYHTAHIVAVVALIRIYMRPLDDLLGGGPWSDAMQLWGAADHFLLAIAYGSFSWGRYQERWAYLTAWLAAIGGGFVAIVYSQGHGSSAAKGALIAIVMVLVERKLYSLQQQNTLGERTRAIVRLVWRLYRRPLLVAGWTASVGIIFLALFRNLILLGGGRIQQTWAAIGLLVITALYALSARMFRRARFVWFAVILIFVPWTILTNLGWFTKFEPDLPDFAISWVVLGWFLFLASLWVERHAPQKYVLPLKTATHFLLPFSMLWAIANTEASLYTVGLSIALYGVSAWLDHRKSRLGVDRSSLEATRFFYPALGLIPLWSVYWLNELSPKAPHEHFGYLLLAFGVLGLSVGILLERIAPRPEWRGAYGLPAYLTGYAALIVGTMLVAHLRGTLALALLYDAILMVASARIFRSSLWLYPATTLTAFSLLLALNEANVAANRQGWWLIGLAVVYLIGAWILRRIGLNSYGSVLIIMGFALTALGLPPSSLDQMGAIYGYAAAALVYAVCAFWLKQPLLLTPASALIVIPYACLIQRSTIPTEYYGLSLFPGAALALLLGWALDRRLGAWKGYPWDQPDSWIAEAGKRFLNWWGLPLYILGFGLASAAPFFADWHADLIALNFLLLTAFYAWAVYRFRSRFWLVLAFLSMHWSLIFYLDHLKLWQRADEAWLRFLPLTVTLMIAGLFIERRWNEGSPLTTGRLFSGWSRPFYLFVFLDMLFAQLGSLRGSFAGTEVTLVNMLLVAVFTSVWTSRGFSYISTFLGFVALLQWHTAADSPYIHLPIQLAALALGYGALGFGYNLLRRRTSVGAEASWYSIWEIPLQRSGMMLSFLVLLMAFILGSDVASWSIRALFGVPVRDVVDLETVYMVIWILSLLGLLYVAAAAVYQRMRLGYLAVGMLLTGWFLYAFYVNVWDKLRLLQWYAVPAGLYLLTIAFLEWRSGHRNLARRLDYIAMLLLLGSLFWQTLVFGLLFALLLVGEGLASLWLGSARRMRRFFYAGMMGVVLAALGQLLNALQEVNQWIIFGGIGLLLVILAIVAERKLEAIRIWQQQVLETWE
jgi:hypothetical protein